MDEIMFDQIHFLSHKVNRSQELHVLKTMKHLLHPLEEDYSYCDATAKG